MKYGAINWKAYTLNAATNRAFLVNLSPQFTRFPVISNMDFGILIDPQVQLVEEILKGGHGPSYLHP